MQLISVAVSLLTLFTSQTAQKGGPVEALIYSTMPSTAAHRPEMAMDGDASTTYRSYYGMDDGDDFIVMLSRPVPVRSIRITTGSGSENLLTNAFFETSADGATYAKAAAFGADGVANATDIHGDVMAVRIRMNRRESTSHLEISEIAIDSPVKISHVQQGPPRGFIDISQAPDLADWAARAEKQMESFWLDTDALLYSDGFITPNAVNVIYRTGPRVTPVAATGGGVMTVNSAYCRQHPDDTGLTVHETAHVVQSGGSPGWLIEAVADYIRWVKFEPQNFRFDINPQKATPHDPYRTGAAFLGWCELHYDNKLVTKLNEATRFGQYHDSLFEKYCGKPIDVLWKEFLTAYETDRAHLLTKPLPASMQPRDLPMVSGQSFPVALTFDTVGIVPDGTSFSASSGFDSEGAAFSGNLLGNVLGTHGVNFKIGSVGQPNVLIAKSQTVTVSGMHKSLWILASAENGTRRDQTIVVTYTDGSTAKFAQNFSDWFQPEQFPGEFAALRMAYRDMADGSRDPRPFYAYGYGFPLDGAKEVASITLPEDSGIRILAVSLAN
jgi:hypothetical protein